MDQMESPDYPPPLVDASRPSLGFPLGTALLLFVIFSLSGIFSCCYHRDKLRSLRNRRPDDIESKPHPPPPNSQQSWTQQSMPVVMPGDEVPRFIALPCPCQPPRSSSNLICSGGGLQLLEEDVLRQLLNPHVLEHVSAILASIRSSSSSSNHWCISAARPPAFRSATAPPD